MSQQLFNNHSGYRGSTRVDITYAELYDIIRRRLEYVTERSDLDASTQNICCEIEKKQGIYPNVPGLEIAE